MARIALTGGAYALPSVIAANQVCKNLYPEVVPQQQGEPTPTTHLLTPGLITLGALPTGRPDRGSYRATNGFAYAACGAALYKIVSPTLYQLITIIGDADTPVSMADNGVDLCLVDGTSGWFVDLVTDVPARIVDDAFYPADRVDYISTSFVFNRAGTRQFFLGDSIARTFDPLYITNKAGRQDKVISHAVTGGNLWIFGQDSSEVWSYSGAADFPLQAVPGAIVEHGCIAAHSLGRTDKSVFWLSRSKDGVGIVLQSSSYEAKRVSTHALEQAFKGYADLSTARGSMYQLGGHTFYVLSFAEASWSYDLATGLWHQWMWLDATGVERPCRAGSIVSTLDRLIAVDRYDGTVYELSSAALTDAGAPIRRVRSFPHSSGGGRRIRYLEFIADMQPGAMPGGSSDAPPLVSLRWSDDEGVSWSNAVEQSFGATGQYRVRPTWRRLGVAADRIWELSWSAPVPTALNGAFVTAEAAAT